MTEIADSAQASQSFEAKPLRTPSARTIENNRNSSSSAAPTIPTVCAYLFTIRL